MGLKADGTFHKWELVVRIVHNLLTILPDDDSIPAHFDGQCVPLVAVVPPGYLDLCQNVRVVEFVEVRWIIACCRTIFRGLELR